jgi:hypothetical protein
MFNSLGDAGATINGFNASMDVLHLGQLMQSIGYSGQDPFADHVLAFVQSGDSTALVLNHGGIQTTMVTLEHVMPSALPTSHSDIIWH